MLAYQNIYASPGNMTKGSDGNTIDAMSLNRIEGIIASLKDESYQPKPSRRTYIPKKNGKSVRWGFRHSMTSSYRNVCGSCWKQSMRAALRKRRTAFVQIIAVIRR